MGEWPRIQLLAYLMEPTDSDLESLAELITRIGGRHWYPSPPLVIDQVDEPNASNPHDHPIRTLGILLEVMSPSSASGELLDIARDRQQLEHVEQLLEVIEEFSRETGAAWMIAYDSRDVGMIVNGIADRSISLGLLQPWKEAVSEGPM